LAKDEKDKLARMAAGAHQARRTRGNRGAVALQSQIEGVNKQWLPLRRWLRHVVAKIPRISRARGQALDVGLGMGISYRVGLKDR
jgi:hypothetical protein